MRRAFDRRPRAQADRRQQPEFDPHRPAPRDPPQAPGDQGGVDGERRVERDLDAQRPGRSDPLQHGPVVVDLHEPVIDPPVVGEDAAQAGIDGQHGQRQPVGREDPQQAPAGVVAQAARGRPQQASGHERAVEQEARDHEEQRHPDVQALDERAVDRLADRRCGIAGVVDEHRQGGDRPQRVHQREARMAGRRRDYRGGGLLAHRQRMVRLPLATRTS